MVLGLSTLSDNGLYWYRSTSVTCTRRALHGDYGRVYRDVIKCALRH